MNRRRGLRIGLATIAAALALPATAGAARTVYIAAYTSDTLSAADIGADGVPTAKPGSPLAVGNGPNTAVLTPDGRFLFLAEQQADQIHRFDVAADGSLTSGPLTPTGTNTKPYGMTVTPDGKYLYATVPGSDQVAGYAIGADGGLTPVPGSPLNVARRPSNRGRSRTIGVPASRS